jgi:hypothetical protein
MEIKRVGSQPSVKGPAEWFTGTVRIDPLFQAPDPALVQGASVTFEPVHAPHGTRIRSVRPSSSRVAAAGLSAQVDLSRRSGPAMWSGSRPARSTGMGLRRPRQ